jgi:hypothetical protein
VTCGKQSSVLGEDEDISIPTNGVVDQHRLNEQTPLQLFQDNSFLVEYDLSMLRHLQTLQWRRVIWDFHLDFRDQFSVHQLAIGKQLAFPFSTPRRSDIAYQAGTWIAAMMVHDFIDALKRDQQE